MTSPVLSPNTKLNITIAATCTGIGALVWATVWAVNLVNGINSKIDTLSGQMTDYKDNTYTKANAAEISLRNAILNPGVYYADPRDPTKTIYVDPTRWNKPPKE